MQLFFSQNFEVWKSDWVCLPPAITLVSCSDYSSTLKMEAIYLSETSVDFQLTTRRYISKDITLLFVYR
jgi:hypothetical protein